MGKSRKGKSKHLERAYGRYHCKDCNVRWESANTWKIKGTSTVKFQQKCRKCLNGLLPWITEPIICSVCGGNPCDCPKDVRRRQHVDPNKSHRSDLCEKCLNGFPCNKSHSNEVYYLDEAASSEYDHYHEYGFEDVYEDEAPYYHDPNDHMPLPVQSGNLSCDYDHSPLSARSSNLSYEHDHYYSNYRAEDYNYNPPKSESKGGFGWVVLGSSLAAAGLFFGFPRLRSWFSGLGKW